MKMARKILFAARCAISISALLFCLFNICRVSRKLQLQARVKPRLPGRITVVSGDGPASNLAGVSEVKRGPLRNGTPIDCN